MSEAEQARAVSDGRQRLKIAAVLAGSAFALLVVSVIFWVVSLGPVPLDVTKEVSITIVDRNGKLVRAFAMKNGRWRLPVKASEVDPAYIDVLLAFEDRRFRQHAGVDPLAFGRAVWQFVSHGRIVSGGSTITMQVARLIEPRRDRTIGAKLRQVVRAIQIERMMSKDEILDLYLRLAPFGGNLEGVRAATIAYFGKEPKRLSLAEAALLVALPQSPETRRLDRHPDAAERARDRVLDRMVELGRVSTADATHAKAEAVPRMRRPMPLLAPHVTDHVVAREPAASRVALTLDANLQRSLEALARDRAIALGPEVSIGIVAVDNSSGDILARVGSPDYFDARRAGQADMTRAVRSPGSTLKPFIYGLAIEDGFVHPESLIDDRPIRYGSYAPENFDMTFQGTVTVRKALQLSLNVPAIALLDRVGPHRLTSRIRQAGGDLVLPKDETPGLAMGLGGVGVTLTDLVQLYAGFPRLGSTVPLRERLDDPRDESAQRRLLDPVAAWHIAHVLMGTPPPENGVHNRIAFKTGTSYGYRDAWSVGFDGRMTIGVWVGRPDGAPVPGLLGRTAAAPILFDAFARSGKIPLGLPAAPRGTLMATTAKLPLPLRRFHPAGELAQIGDRRGLRIQFPLNGSRLDVMAEDGAKMSPVAVKVAGGVPPMTVLVNGLSAGELDSRRQKFVEPPGPGFVRLTVMDATGAADTVVVRLQ
ncbi:penicillin-binding protein 1C [Bradyrhizobium sp. LHD-71]|uniref:penicillin-binding protein 1C n=1 Tax=Bradyrhizobium sp. LHD-71 TaxID=3072141 RepID=UPI00280C80DA|nr:penicillin-binding protein 1C [Bradyrhizobium sp. LHD-71]MDQ8730121.1 penicillin-binding protein 1C [Bradyrhizobium sp. LHD-71]